ncbi:MAG: TdeIII family type II restriction endonuclease [Chloroflexi bacterium]|nr:TdeIII family type II restriction endonuclease [Chloroflexota bacterium]
MTTQGQMKDAIQTLIQRMMDRVMIRVMVEDPWIVEHHRANRPLYAALVPDEIFKNAHFERRFVTPFGKVWERLAKTAADNGFGRGFMDYTITGTVRQGRLHRIQEILNALEHPGDNKSRIRPDWDSELRYVLEGTGELLPVPVTSDVYIENTSGTLRYAFEVKAPLPNSDQTKVSKEKMLKLYSMEPRLIDSAFFALPYNPYGTRDKYAWTFPARWFDMKKDKVVLIGDEFWEIIGGAGTYQAFITAINEIGEKYRNRIYREYLGIEPPSDSSVVKL